MLYCSKIHSNNFHILKCIWKIITEICMFQFVGDFAESFFRTHFNRIKEVPCFNVISNTYQGMCKKSMKLCE